HFERAETTFVDVEIRRGERLEGDARRRDAAGAAGIQRRRHLRIHLAEVDRHLRAFDPHRNLHAQRLVERATVVVENALGLVDAIRNFLDHLAGRLLGLVPDLGNAGFYHLTAIARDQLAVAAGAELAGRDLRTQVAEARVRIAHVVANDLPERLVALARLVDLERADLQAFAINVIRRGRAET